MAAATKGKSPAAKNPAAAKAAPKVEDAPAVVEPSGPSTVVLPAVVDQQVAKIKKYLREQVWMQNNNEQYKAIIEQLKKEL